MWIWVTTEILNHDIGEILNRRIAASENFVSENVVFNHYLDTFDEVLPLRSFALLGNICTS